MKREKAEQLNIIYSTDLLEAIDEWDLDILDEELLHKLGIRDKLKVYSEAVPVVLDRVKYPDANWMP